MPDFSKTNKAQVWSCGGGTQSCAIAALIVQGKLPKPDFSVIADTGYETNATWEFMDRVLVPELGKVGVVLERCEARRIQTPSRCNITNVYTAKSKTPGEYYTVIPVFSTLNGSCAKLPNLCTTQWKREVMDAYLSRVKGITRSKFIYWIGYSRDEQRRWVRAQQTEEYKKALTRFPLCELGLTRQDCIKLVESMGWGTPPRSACYMCPNHSDHEWRELIAERPDEFQKAVEIEREIHKVDPDAWLHRSCIPLDQVDFSQPEDLFSRPCDSGLCFV